MDRVSQGRGLELAGCRPQALSDGRACWRATCRWGPGCHRRPPSEMAAAGPWPPPATWPGTATIGQLGQRAENRWIGVNCGIMDQMISATGQAGHAMLIDCRSLETQPAPIPAGVAVVVSTRHMPRPGRFGLQPAAGPMRGGGAVLRVKALRDVRLEEFESGRGDGETIRRRARHVITRTSGRSSSGSDAPRRRVRPWAADEPKPREPPRRLRGIQRCAERDGRCAPAHRACYGARMTGAGFGGCAVAIVRDAARFCRPTSAAYQERPATRRRSSVPGHQRGRGVGRGRCKPQTCCLPPSDR